MERGVDDGAAKPDTAPYLQCGFVVQLAMSLARAIPARSFDTPEQWEASEATAPTTEAKGARSGEDPDHKFPA